MTIKVQAPRSQLPESSVYLEVNQFFLFLFSRLSKASSNVLPAQQLDFPGPAVLADPK